MKNNNIPKVWFSHNRLLLESYDHDFTQSDHKDFIKEIKEFNSLVEKNKNELLKNISFLTGIPWFRKEIPIYVIPDNGDKSFSHPLIVVYRVNPRNRLFVLTHEFTHINSIADRDDLFDKGTSDYRISYGVEAVCWYIAKLAIEKTANNEELEKYKKEWDIIWDKYLSDKDKEVIKEMEENWDFNKETLVEHCKSRR